MSSIAPIIPQIQCISQWISGWWGTCEAKPGPSFHQSDPTDCKACREWHVPCDHSQPQCEHCYEQQILCFYVKPKMSTRSAALTVPRIREPTPRQKRTPLHVIPE